MALAPASATVSGARYLEKRYELRNPPEIVKFHLTNGAGESFEISGLVRLAHLLPVRIPKSKD